MKLIYPTIVISFFLSASLDCAGAACTSPHEHLVDVLQTHPELVDAAESVLRFGDPTDDFDECAGACFYWGPRTAPHGPTEHLFLSARHVTHCTMLDGTVFGEEDVSWHYFAVPGGTGPGGMKCAPNMESGTQVILTQFRRAFEFDYGDLAVIKPTDPNWQPPAGLTPLQVDFSWYPRGTEVYNIGALTQTGCAGLRITHQDDSGNPKIINELAGTANSISMNPCMAKGMSGGPTLLRETHKVIGVNSSGGTAVSMTKALWQWQEFRDSFTLPIPPAGVVNGVAPALGNSHFGPYRIGKNVQINGTLNRFSSNYSYAAGKDVVFELPFFNNGTKVLIETEFDATFVVEHLQYNSNGSLQARQVLYNGSSSGTSNPLGDAINNEVSHLNYEITENIPPSTNNHRIRAIIDANGSVGGTGDKFAIKFVN